MANKPSFNWKRMLPFQPNRAQQGNIVRLWNQFKPRSGRNDSFAQTIFKNEDSESLKVNVFSNTFSIVNLSGNFWETQKIEDTDNLFTPLVTGDVEPVFSKIEAIMHILIKGQHTYVVQPFIAKMADDSTIATTESNSPGVAGAIAAAITGAHEIIYCPEYIPDFSKDLDSITDADGTKLYSHSLKIDILPEVAKAIKAWIRADDENENTVPWVCFGVAVRMNDNASTCVIHTRIIQSYSLQRRKVRVG